MNQCDTELLEFIYYRLLNVYEEKPNTGYMLHLGTLGGLILASLIAVIV